MAGSVCVRGGGEQCIHMHTCTYVYLCIPIVKLHLPQSRGAGPYVLLLLYCYAVAEAVEEFCPAQLRLSVMSAVPAILQAEVLCVYMCVCMYVCSGVQYL